MWCTKPTHLRHEQHLGHLGHLRAETPDRELGFATFSRRARPRSLKPHAPEDSRWVLVTDDNYGKASGSVAAVRRLAAAGYHPAVAFSTPVSLAAASRYCLRQIRVPSHRAEGYAAAIAAELEAHSYLTVLPTTDVALRALDRPEALLLDKSRLARLAKEAGMDMPPTTFFPTTGELLAEAHHLDYPVMVKPTVKHAARVAHGPDDLEWWAGKPGEVLVQPYLQREQEFGVAGLVWEGKIVASVRQQHLRTWPPEAGSTCAARTVAVDPVVEARLLELLKGYNGVFEADFMGPYLIDVNPRVYASLRLAMGAGVNLVGLYCDLLRGESVDRVEGRPGVSYRWLDADVRNLIGAWRQHKLASPAAFGALRPRRGTVYAIESKSDWRPTLARARYGLTTGRWRRAYARD
ncbi:MAG: ATP-grasp domain-containing protein [Actinobacteria bacterium]|nr:ATP-grasp domain-containing protein [Actinomycetota bacterium]